MILAIGITVFFAVGFAIGFLLVNSLNRSSRKVVLPKRYEPKARSKEEWRKTRWDIGVGIREETQEDWDEMRRRVEEGYELHGSETGRAYTDKPRIWEEEGE